MAVKPILLDTNAYSAFKRGNTEALHVVQRPPKIAINTNIFGELLGGFAAGTRESENRRELEVFLSSPRVTLLSVERETSERYAALYARRFGMRGHRSRRMMFGSRPAQSSTGLRSSPMIIISIVFPVFAQAQP